MDEDDKMTWECTVDLAENDPDAFGKDVSKSILAADAELVALRAENARLREALDTVEASYNALKEERNALYENLSMEYGRRIELEEENAELRRRASGKE